MPLVLLALLLTLFAPFARADSFWDHNGSVMRLQADGAYRWITYERPRAGIAAEGVSPGTLLFDGVRQGDRYSGTARVFSSVCAAPMAYRMDGYVVNNSLIVLEGSRPEFRNCRATGEYRYERLEFSYLYSDTPPAPTQGGAAVQDVAGITELAVSYLLGDPYGRTRAETRSYITGVTLGGTCGAGVWIVTVVVPKSTLGGSLAGYVGIDDRSGEFVCTNLPLLD